jgi:hypothetical protein
VILKGLAEDQTSRFFHGTFNGHVTYHMQQHQKGWVKIWFLLTTE